MLIRSTVAEEEKFLMRNVLSDISHQWFPAQNRIILVYIFFVYFQLLRGGSLFASEISDPPPGEQVVFRRLSSRAAMLADQQNTM